MKRAFAWMALVLGVGWFWNNAPMVLYGKRTAGHVVDAVTGRPIPGAHVALLWESTTVPKSFMGESGRAVCFHAAAAVTNAQGRFEIEPWRELSSYRVYVMNPVVLVYARNYVPVQSVIGAYQSGPPVPHLDERFALKPFNGTVDERIQMLFWGLANRGCMYGKESQRNLYPMMKAIHDEAQVIAQTPDQRRTVGNIAALAARAALVINPNSPGDDAGIKAFIRENMQ
jgi:hypothetical protein